MRRFNQHLNHHTRQHEHSRRPELFFLSPCLYVVAIYLFTFYPDPFVALVPDFKWKHVDDRARILTTSSYIPELVTAKIKITEVHRLKELGLLETKNEEEEIVFILRQCATRIRENVKFFTEDLLKDVSIQQLTGEGIAGTLAKAAGLLKFTNILWLIAILLGVASFGAIVVLFHEYIRQLIINPLIVIFRAVILLIRNTPPEIHLFKGYFVCFAFHVVGKSIASTASEFVALTGGIGVVAMFIASVHVHYGLNGRSEEKKMITTLQIFCAVTWAPAAVMFDSSIFGFMTCMTVLGLFGFCAESRPLEIVIGFENENDLIHATMAALMMLLSFTGIRIAGGIRSPFPGAAHAAVENGMLIARLTRPFELGCLFMGTFVYFTGILIGSSKMFTRRLTSQSDYTRMNILALLSGFAALYFGNVYNIGPLNGVGGTFFILWMLQKYGEHAPLWRDGMWPFGLAGLSAIIYFLSLFIHSHPEYVISFFDTPSN